MIGQARQKCLGYRHGAIRPPIETHKHVPQPARHIPRHQPNRRRSLPLHQPLLQQRGTTP